MIVVVFGFVSGFVLYMFVIVVICDVFIKFIVEEKIKGSF